MAVKRTYVKQARPQFVPIGPDQVEKRKADIEAKRAYIESLRTGKQLEDGTAGMRVENIDIDALEKQLERDEKALAFLAPKEGTAAEKRKALKDFEEAKEYIRTHGLTLAEIGKYPKPMDPEKDADYGKAVEKSMAMEVGNPEFQRMCQQLKRSASVLEPDNPELRNVNRYRQER